jgi:cation:H+ antiporter
VDTLLHCLGLFGGIGILVVFSDWLVDGAVWAARKLGVSPFAVGLTIVAYGTSLPEAVVSVTAGMEGASEFAIANIVGSNIANIGLVLGITALIAPIAVAQGSSLFRTEAPWLIGATIIAFCAGACDLFEAQARLPLVFSGALLVIFSLLYTKEALTGHGPGHYVGEAVEGSVKMLRRTILRGGRNVESDDRLSGPHRIQDLFSEETTAVMGSHSAREISAAPAEVEPTEASVNDGTSEGDDEAEEDAGWGKIAVYLFGGLAGLVVGAKLMVWGGTEIASTLGVSDRIIAVTIVAIGTSLPELAASIAAAKRGHPELAVGNVVGSCLFNLTFVLGAAAMAAPITLDWGMMWIDFVVMLVLTLAMFVLLWSDRVLTRFEAATLVLTYVLFLSWVGYQAVSTNQTQEQTETAQTQSSRSVYDSAIRTCVQGLWVRPTKTSV